jgi:CO/xanthine dehydrogenase Mo-binding subunit
VDSYRPTNCPPAYLSCFVEIEVDTWTGIVRTLRTALGVDCGTVVNPDGAIGQLEGGLSRGMGMGLYEDIQWDEQGQLRSKGYLVEKSGIMESPQLEELSALCQHRADRPAGAKASEGGANQSPTANAFTTLGSASMSCLSPRRNCWRRCMRKNPW